MYKVWVPGLNPRIIWVLEFPLVELTTFWQSSICYLQVFVVCLLHLFLVSRLKWTDVTRSQWRVSYHQFFSFGCAWLVSYSVACDWFCRLRSVYERVVPVSRFIRRLMSRLFKYFSILIVSLIVRLVSCSMLRFIFKIHRVWRCFDLLCKRRNLFSFQRGNSMFIFPYSTPPVCGANVRVFTVRARDDKYTLIFCLLVLRLEIMLPILRSALKMV